ncbi:alpha-D-xyloside xylohydrolase [Microbacterium halimionae]|uniref:alpha-D-xyloside xylohydrolase n=1 Tax=Microbacterium halimionae TaxID=1526413 RepID=A0A7W3JLX5_9MICO|nr:alpha-xylosidase [Microbacterium halimionae]MBA8815257.1 alpha-D-xyloside xylohydrolase [Microbacterium halimionae]NII93952.1 alpha-D-xyloside xylohydrolase [Microbacterium halimionae]
MKFTDGFWQTRPGVTALYAQEAYDVWATDDTPDGSGLVVTAPAAVIHGRGDTLNRPVLTTTLSSPAEGVVRVRVTHHAGSKWHGGFELPGAVTGVAETSIDETAAVLSTGSLSVRVGRSGPWSLDFEVDGRRVTGSGHKSEGYIQVAPDAQVDPGRVGTQRDGANVALAPSYVHEQLELGIGELVYGLGERFGPLVKNGQSVDVWNADGGTSSEQAYKNVPFYLTNRGYGVLVNDTGHVSFEIGSEAVERVQFSVEGEALEYFVFAGPTPKDVLARYTSLTGRPPVVPAWSYGLWLSTSFTTDYDEATVSSFIDEMATRELPVSVFHFDCFWMREFNWCDFEWDPRVFPDPTGMLARLHEKDLKVCVWINPYIGQRSPLFSEAAAHGYLVTRADGSVWQWDMWQAGMGLVDFTNPEATAWYQSKLRALVDQGVDCFKTDFGERIPTDVTWADGSDPMRMHNQYAQLYNKAVYDVLAAAKGANEAVLFARSATAGGQTMPVHWGGDSTSSFVSMAETLRGGLSLAFSGFAYWSHDIGGFEGTPDAAVYKRWTAFGLLGSHSRFHGSSSYRVPWQFDEEAVEVTRVFTRLKMRLMPYLYRLGIEAAETGAPIMRPMQLEFPNDPSADHLDRQYMLGSELLVAPVFSTEGEVNFYLPAGIWTNVLTGEEVTGGAWRTEKHSFTSIPLYARPGAVIPWGARDDRPDYDYLDGLRLRVFSGKEGERTVRVTTPDGRTETLKVNLDEVTR